MKNRDIMSSLITSLKTHGPFPTRKMEVLLGCWFIVLQFSHPKRWLSYILVGEKGDTTIGPVPVPSQSP